MVERLVDVPIVLQADFDRQARAHPPGMLGLFARNRQSYAGHAETLGGVTQRAAPAAADVEDPLSPLQAQLATDQVQLCFLRGVQVERDRALR